MNYVKGVSINSCLGQRKIDTQGSPVGMVRMDVNHSYAGIGDLLMDYINNSDQEAWEKITAKINYTFENLNLALTPLNGETNFIHEINARVSRGQKLLFKPNLVNIHNIDPRTHGPGFGNTACTEWAFIAALMRWFHDNAGVSYCQMSLGEAATTMASAASLYSMINPQGKAVTTEAVIEGKAGDFYGGWGFYFARKYLAETLEPSSAEDPMKGFDDSVAGNYIPPGHVADRLMVYDLNRICDDPNKGREVEVPGGVNFSSITLHKAVVGGNPADAEDTRSYPGCVLINVPKLKMHNIAIFTNVIKNLGIGLYPMQAASEGGCSWDYSFPHTDVPGMKARIPHQVWEAEIDHETAMPKRDASGSYIVRKTGGLPATMIDIIKAVSNQGIFMFHAVDAIEAIDWDNTGFVPDTKRAEGLVFTGLDPVATDLLCARYVFSNVPLEEAIQVDLDDGTGGRFPQKAPVPKVEGSDIVTGTGYDCPLARDISFAHAEKNGLGQRKYYVVGHDILTGAPLVSLEGHLGTVKDGAFSDVFTQNLYYDVSKICWDLQLTSFKYLEAADSLEGASYKEKFLEAFDENGDGVVTYEDFGKKGLWGVLLYTGAMSASRMGSELLGFMKGSFLSSMTTTKCCNPLWNPGGHDILDGFSMNVNCQVAYRLSRADNEGQDPFLPSLTWGKGRWPSFQFANYVRIGTVLYGPDFPSKVNSEQGMYSQAFRYADLTQNQGRYALAEAAAPGSDALQLYVVEVKNGQAKPMDFTIYVPAGYAKFNGMEVPNIEETTDPNKLLTARFQDGQEIWAELMA
ncbi:MAG: DUF362 domain-containing protein [Deltaproteobacteria bacterium]|nr:DUF362 domain-containing protein [Deltaproteobacteria bacterium]